MTRALRFTFFGLLIVFGALIALWIFAFNTAPGRNFIKAQIEQQIAKSVGGTAQIGTLAPGLPNAIILTDIVIRDLPENEPALLTADLLEIRWQPLALISGAIDIDRLIVSNLTLDHLPAPKQDEARDANTPITLPDQLPDVRIGSLQLTDITLGEAVAGKTVTLAGDGTLDMAGRQLALALSIATQNGSDQINLNTDIDLAAKRFSAKGKIESAPGGLITHAANLDGPLSLTINGNQQDRTAIATIIGDIGTMGAIDIALSGEMVSGSTITMAGEFSPGQALLDIEPYTGASVSFNLDAAPAGKGTTIDIQSVQAKAGSLAGVVSWQDNSDVLSGFETDLTAMLAKDFDPDIIALTGSKIKIESSVQKQSSTLYALAAQIKADKAQITLKNATTNAASTLNGDVSGTLTLAPLLPENIRTALPKPLSFSANIAADTDKEITVSKVTLASGTAFTGSGSATYAVKSNALQSTMKATLSSAPVKSLLQAGDVGGPLTLNASLYGASDNFAIDAKIDAPAITRDTLTIPASMLSANISGLPSAPTGQLNGKPVDGTEGGLDLFVQSNDGVIHVSSLNYFGTGFSLVGETAVDPENQSLAIDLVYTGEPNAHPFPGIGLAGSLSAKGGFGSNVPQILGSETQPGLTIAAPSLLFNEIAARGLEATINGTSEQATIAVLADDIRQGDQSVLSNLTMVADIAVSQTITSTITTLNGRVLGETDFQTRAPTQLTIGEALSLDSLDMSWGERGLIQANGTIEPTRWLANISIKDAIIPSTDGLITLNVSLDTDKSEPAQGTFSVDQISLPVDDDDDRSGPSKLSGALIWDAVSLQLSDQQGNDTLPISFNISLPAKLERTANLGVNTDGPLSGAINYDGAITPLIAAIPGPAQGLEGTIAIDVDLSGTLSAPEIEGRTVITDGAYTEEQTGLSLIGLHLEAQASTNSTASSVSFKGGGRGASQEGQDRFTLDGRLELGEASMIETNIEIRDLIISATPLTSLEQSGDITIKGPLNAISIEGDIDITEMNLEIITPPATGLVPIEVVAKRGSDVASGAPEQLVDETTEPDEQGALRALNLSVVADDRLFVRGRGLESEWETDIDVTMVDDAPLILGQIDLRRGTFDFSGRRFDVTTGEIIFDRLSPNDPNIDIVAEYETSDGLIARVSASGRSSDIDVELTSVPTRPANDVMAFILFGKPAEQLTAVESLQTAQALASLGGIGPFGGGGPLGALRNTAGLDLLNVDLDPENGASALTVGKYVADGLFVSATQDIEGKNGSVRIEYEITDNITVESNVRQDGDQTLSANWKKDF